MIEQKPYFVLITESTSKVNAFKHACGKDIGILHRRPVTDEKKLSSMVGYDSHRARNIAERKLLASLSPVLMGGVLGYLDQFIRDGQLGTLELIESGRVIQVVTDSVQVVYNDLGGIEYVLEKPNPTVEDWMERGDHLLQSGKKVGIITAISGIPLPTSPSHYTPLPQTVLVTTRATMGYIDEKEFLAYLNNGGRKTIAETAGGFSLCNGARRFYEDIPLTVSYQDGLQEDPTIIFQCNDWKAHTRENLFPFVYGTFKEAMDGLVEKCTK